MLYGLKGDIPEKEYLIEIGKADVKKSGQDVTLITWGKITHLSLQAAKKAQAKKSSQEGSH